MEPHSLTERQTAILHRIRSLRAGRYRREALAELSYCEADQEALLAAGMVKVNKAGSVSLTTAGKNASRL